MSIDQFKATSKNVIPAKAGIQKFLTSLDSRFCGSDELIIMRGSLKLKSFISYNALSEKARIQKSKSRFRVQTRKGRKEDFTRLTFQR
jgi:hypothetical protein